MNSTNPKIEILPENIIDQIKAGEVIERPSSLIKELIENSIDAKSTDIQLHLIENGLDLISIEDDGIGIDFSNLPFAFVRHATSKLKKFEDLYDLHSFGFRGEALASIASIARVTCQTQPENLKIEGGKIIINGGHEELLIPTTHSKKGTSLFIKDLFYNTPARLKFIKSKNAEKLQLKKIIYSFVISNPGIQFGIKWDQKEKEVFPKLDPNQYQDRVKGFIVSKNHHSDTMLSADESYQNYRVQCFFSSSAFKNSPYKNQYIFINKRLVLDKSIHQAILRSSDQLWKYGESGNYIVFIDTPLDEIDVNVHPSKTQIKFLKTDVIFSLLHNAFKVAIKKYLDTQIKNETPLFESSLSEKSYGPDFSFSIDSQNLTLNNQWKDPRPVNNVFPQISIEASSEGWQKIHPLFWISHSYGTAKIFSIKKILSLYFASNFQVQPLNEDDIYPLLISEPIKNFDPSNELLEVLKLQGFELEKINQSIYVLRTTPKNFERQLIELFFDCLKQTSKPNQLNEPTFLSFLNSFDHTKFSYPNQLIEELISQNPTYVQLSSIEINDKNLGKLFE